MPDTIGKVDEFRRKLIPCGKPPGLGFAITSKTKRKWANVFECWINL
jgi:hypothetical protein